MGFFSDLGRMFGKGPSSSIKVKKTGFLQKDVDIFKQSGNTLAGISSPGVIAPKQTTLKASSTSPSSFSKLNDLSNVSKDQIGILTNIFKARLDQIQRRRRNPGVLQSRGEL